MSEKLEVILNILEEIKIQDIEIEIGEEKTAPICLYSREEFEEGQLGYRQNHLGESFIGVEEGDWKESWYVIGYDDLLGDPIFIDVKKKSFPVYTAIPGEGKWEARLLYPTFNQFIKVVNEQK